MEVQSLKWPCPIHILEEKVKGGKKKEKDQIVQQWTQVPKKKIPEGGG